MTLSMYQTFMKFLLEKARKDERIYFVIQDGGYGLIDEFVEEFPDRIINVGIAEQNAISIAAGLAMSGKIVYVWNLIPFLIYRPYEQVRLNIAYMNTNVKLIGTGAGYAHGLLGTTHHAIEDIAIMRATPNMLVAAPGDCTELSEILEQSYTYNGPMYIRIGKTNGEVPTVNSNPQDIQLGKSTVIREGNDLALIASGTTLNQGSIWVQELEKRNISTSLISMHTIKPFDKECILQLIEKQIPIVTLEEHNMIGGLGSAVAEVIASSGRGIPYLNIGVPDSFSHHIGKQDYQRVKMGIDNIETVINFIENKKINIL
ncbi:MULTISPECIES: transketolase family protein [Bacillus cereus group]|uniref:transketolase family protein n=2 Tax=Bacillus cereus group TaxID=86661 RepID=UPI0002DDE1C6|nr:transketolase C-terminal domain-containing protein [Bacillus thuringiensis]